jgi:hypothetical protein
MDPQNKHITDRKKILDKLSKKQLEPILDKLEIPFKFSANKPDLIDAILKKEFSLISKQVVQDASTVDDPLGILQPDTPSVSDQESVDLDQGNPDFDDSLIDQKDVLAPHQTGSGMQSQAKLGARPDATFEEIISTMKSINDRVIIETSEAEIRSAEARGELRHRSKSLPLSTEVDESTGVPIARPRAGSVPLSSKPFSFSGTLPKTINITSGAQPLEQSLKSQQQHYDQFGQPYLIKALTESLKQFKLRSELNNGANHFSHNFGKPIYKIPDPITVKTNRFGSTNEKLNRNTSAMWSY